MDVLVNLLEQKTSHIPGPAWHTAYTPDRIAIETGNGDVMEELYNPRASYAGPGWETPWTNLQLAYFTGYSSLARYQPHKGDRWLAATRQGNGPYPLRTDRPLVAKH